MSLTTNFLSNQMKSTFLKINSNTSERKSRLIYKNRYHKKFRSSTLQLDNRILPELWLKFMAPNSKELILVICRKEMIHSLFLKY